ncbi:hypothetical protein TYRP_004428 [Tyrophagus putrescentiae]|nr:hypothetical protein TYRP_004428 [Tyrophagus putrescentiae]
MHANSTSLADWRQALGGRKGERKESSLTRDDTEREAKSRGQMVQNDQEGKGLRFERWWRMAATYEGAPRTAEEVAQCNAETGQSAEEEEEEEGKDHARQMATDSSDSNGV